MLFALIIITLVIFIILHIRLLMYENEALRKWINHALHYSMPDLSVLNTYRKYNCLHEFTILFGKALLLEAFVYVIIIIISISPHGASAMKKDADLHYDRIVRMIEDDISESGNISDDTLAWIDEYYTRWQSNTFISNGKSIVGPFVKVCPYKTFEAFGISEYR